MKKLLLLLFIGLIPHFTQAAGETKKAAAKKEQMAQEQQQIYKNLRLVAIYYLEKIKEFKQIYKLLMGSESNKILDQIRVPALKNEIILANQLKPAKLNIREKITTIDAIATLVEEMYEAYSFLYSKYYYDLESWNLDLEGLTDPKDIRKIF